ncbi:MAG: tRNA (adenosine(37)-N6)-threonylcarbamoyltransferase complex dimerization subunit type 1 TsaB [Bifidobacteriaceae bacterium]|jgi:tRNA threonylcarbamoyl adenosine modification protein YeaZ|nr:tRNA (adenosine(37)-N6)-threonylcarbamoyltransferase complex dimerization subunit type 1 TsaB [Bifidobacteriaceae bacterium]
MTLQLIIDSSFNFMIGLLDLDTGKVLDYKTSLSDKTHVEDIVPKVKKIISNRQPISSIRVGAGPGAFTGLRAGIAAAQGLAFGLAVPIWGFNSLLAQAISVNSAEVLIINNARRKQVYWGHFVKTDNKYQQIALDIDDESKLDILKSKAGIFIAGNMTNNKIDTIRFLTSVNLCPKISLKPLYLRQADVG